MINIISFIIGFIFSIGLTISGMINPNKVIAFLDIFGNWDFSLLFVMGGAVGVNLLLFPMIFKNKPFLATYFSLPNKVTIDWKLIMGSIMFGIGWGLVGICPGPGIVNLVTLSLEPIIFVFSMILGMFIFKLSPWS